MPEPRVTLPGTERAAPAGALAVGAPNPAQTTDVSIYLKPREPHGHAPHAHPFQHRAAQHSPDLDRIADFATKQGLTVIEQDPARRFIRVGGTVAALAQAFGATVHAYEADGRRFNARTGTLSLPADLAGSVEAVLGLDERAVARAKVVWPRAAVPGFAPNAVAQAYGVPADPALGQGRTIAIVELGGGFLPTDTAQAFDAMGLPTPTVVAVGVGGALNRPGVDTGADGEVALDIQIAGAVAPAATIAVYFADNTAQGFVDAVSQAAHDTQRPPAVISISWGGPENSWTGQTAAALDSAIADAAALGVTVCCASGDGLATDGVADGKAHVDFPASSPSALGCGGTRLDVSGGGVAEQVWKSNGGGTGGGVSDLFAPPTYQAQANVPTSVNGGTVGRGVPDVSADADPSTGFRVVIGGRTQVIGGTSAAAPLWAGLFAALGKGATGFGAPHAKLYAAVPSPTRDVTVGDNRAGGVGYDAGPGWDACTGLGSPDWAALSALFGAG